ncbi:folylpolyglutamate synthase, mitochondrial-like isoform X2 [Ptychodera flava]|uniref:folylpolyglutamate synthase, mitochondrial-like isoform X2 n=1 Tax=Ptychodera flava TaxID=63121 RepID=UPI00396A495D
MCLEIDVAWRDQLICSLLYVVWSSPKSIVMLKVLARTMRSRTIVSQCTHTLGATNSTLTSKSTTAQQHTIAAPVMAGEVVSKTNYEEAVRVLNTLQTNAAVLEKIRRDRGRRNEKSLPETIQFLERVGITLDDIDNLSIIHVSGTKGKGSTCAYCESILRANGFKTGFYSSPHLVEVRERIRINGIPLAKDEFSKYFFRVFSRLEETKDLHDGAMPAYFRFLTILAFHVFIQEKVDVAIVEVGIGGAYDCTNVVRCPVVTGITSLGMDHTSVLGDTLDKIAWHKAGICKPGRPAFTVPQPSPAMEAVIKRARELQAPIQVTPDFENYDWQGRPVELGLAGEHQKQNATLAMQLCRTWIEEHKATLTEGPPELKKQKLMNGEIDLDEMSITTAPTFKIIDTFIYGLRSCYWAGRTQKMTRDRVTYYLDGAHTARSVQACVKWFMDIADEEAKTIEGPVARVLVFNAMGDRNEKPMLRELVDCKFDAAAFCPNIASIYNGQTSADQTNLMTTTQKQQARCEKHRASWQELEKEAGLLSQPPSPSTASSSRTQFLQDSVSALEALTKGGQVDATSAVIS